MPSHSETLQWFTSSPSIARQSDILRLPTSHIDRFCLCLCHHGVSSTDWYVMRVYEHWVVFTIPLLHQLPCIRAHPPHLSSPTIAVIPSSPSWPHPTFVTTN